LICLIAFGIGYVINNNNGSNSGGTKNNDGQCKKEDCNFGNNNGCLSSDEVWKEWYCKF
jgi:hypothetical protein